MKLEKNIRMFLRFLKEKGIYSLYFNEVKRNKYHLSTLNFRFNGDIYKLLTVYNSCPKQIINHSIIWNHTFHGYSFWNQMSKEFRDWYNENERTFA